VVEPWLNGFERWQPCAPTKKPNVTLQDIECATNNTPPRFVSIDPGSCDVMIRTHEDAVEALAYASVCTDAAIEKLTVFAKERPHATLWSDLAGAYAVRARRQDQPSDYAHALAAAEAALILDPDLPAARFNAALAEEGLDFPDKAIERWISLSDAAPAGWENEARDRAKRLVTERGLERAAQWRIKVQQLPNAVAVRKEDPKALRDLIAPFRSSAQNHVEEVVLRDWAQAAEAGNGREAEKNLTTAEAVASVLAQLNHDHYLIDAVARIRATRDPQTAAALRQGHRELANARKKQRDLGEETPQTQYERAERAFTRAGSPLRLGAALGRIAMLTQRRKFDEAWLALQETEQAALRGSYRHFLARIHSSRGYYYTVKGSLLQALGHYDTAQAIYTDTDDIENIGLIHTRKIGLFLGIGDVEEAWREIVRTRQHRFGDVVAQHILFGESARAAVTIKEAGIAVRYQSAAVRLLEDELPQTEERFVPQVRSNLGIAFRARASIRAFAEDRDGAQADLTEAQRLIGDSAKPSDSIIARGFQARLSEAKAHTLELHDRAGAIEWLTKAIHEAEQTHYRTLLASLLVQRAALRHQEGARTAELQDLQNALDLMNSEAEEVRKVPQAALMMLDERLWSAYFSRSQEAYRRLVRLLIDSGDPVSAFNRAEEARVYEPLHLAYQRIDLPIPFNDWLQTRKPFSLGAVQDIVPEGTFLLQFAVFDDKTYVWIVRRGASEFLELDVRNEQIARWTTRLQEYADSRSDEKFREALAAPYAALLQKPLERVDRLHHEATPAKLVIIPDGAMPGLPFAALGIGGDSVLARYRVVVAASSTLYAFSLDQDRQLAKQPPESLLLVGDPAFNSSQELARGLKQSEPGLRVGRIEQIYAPLIRVEQLVRQNATVPRFLELAARGSIIHLAAHGIANPDVPSRSFFLLAPAENDAGALDAERLLRELRLQRTRLAVLAACSSAGGTAVGSEGLAPLVRPLVVAGVPGVIGTLWNVSSQQETEELLVRFHGYYSKGVEAGDALRLAQLEMRSDPDASRNTPRAWGAFQMIGHASSPFPAGRQTKRR
jgi:CHAT domain-containing protein